MKIYLTQGAATVEWNDSGEPITASLSGMIYQADEQALRDLYACLGFLFSKPNA